MQSKNITNNLAQIWKNVGKKDGWDISRHNDMLMLKSPTMIPNLNLAIINGDVKDTKRITEYFANTPFSVISSHDNSVKLEVEPKVSVEITEMQLSAKELGKVGETAGVKIVSNDLELYQWCEASWKVFGFDTEEMLKFCKDMYHLDRSQLLHFQENGRTVGIGQIYVDDTNLVYVASIGVLEESRRKGIGQQIMATCLKNGCALGGDSFALHASEAGEFLYKKLGFKPIEKWNFSVY